MQHERMEIQGVGDVVVLFATGEAQGIALNMPGLGVLSEVVAVTAGKTSSRGWLKLLVKYLNITT